MKLATYNIWDSPVGMPERFDQIISEITNCNADIICLQEVSDEKMHQKIARACGYDNNHFHNEMGLSIFSRSPILSTSDMDYATTTVVLHNNIKILVTNLHLPWKSALKRERAIVDIVTQTNNIDSDYSFVLGDFNCSPHSSIHRFLVGDQSLCDTDAYFFDLAEAYSEIKGIILDTTLDFVGNPRWDMENERNTIQTNQRFDRILIKNPFPKKYPILKKCDVFGTEISPQTSLSASDHYGVAVDLSF